MGKINFEDYRASWETGPHWELKKEFLEMYQDVFPEDRLLCLAQAYSNVELMHCSYPAPVMREIHELSKKLHACKRFREEQNSTENHSKNKGKRSFPDQDSGTPYKFIKFCASGSDIAEAVPTENTSEDSSQFIEKETNCSSVETVIASSDSVSATQYNKEKILCDSHILISISKSPIMPFLQKIVNKVRLTKFDNPNCKNVEKLEQTVNSMNEGLNLYFESEIRGKKDCVATLFIGDMKFAVGRGPNEQFAKSEAADLAWNLMRQSNHFPITNLNELTSSNDLYHLFEKLCDNIVEKAKGKKVSYCMSTPTLSAFKVIEDCALQVMVDQKHKLLQDIAYFFVGEDTSMKVGTAHLCDLVIRGVWVARGQAQSKKQAKLEAAKEGCFNLLRFFEKDNSEILTSLEIKDVDNIKQSKKHETRTAIEEAKEDLSKNVEAENKVQEIPPSKKDMSQIKILNETDGILELNGVKRLFTLNRTLLKNSIEKGIILLDTSALPRRQNNQSAHSIFAESIAFCKKKIVSEFDLDSSAFYRCNHLVDGKVVGSAVAPTKTEAKAKASEQAVENLRNTVYTVKIRDENNPGVYITPTMVKGLYEGRQQQKVPEHNVGHKMLKMMGWAGGGIGKSEGIAEPIQANDRHRYQEGLGFANSTTVVKQFKDKIQTLLKDYSMSNSLSDLIFSPEFSKEERKLIHEVAPRYNLNSVSHGKDESRQLYVKHKNKPVKDLLYHLIETDGISPKYELIDPTQT